MMSMIFLGYGTYGAASLKGLLGAFGPSAFSFLVTHPAKQGDEDSLCVSQMAQHYGIPYAESLAFAENELIERVNSLAPDFIISTNWRRKIPAAIYTASRIAALNIHDALLPKFGGLGAEQWVILKGENKTGVTVHLIEELMDTGKIILQREFPIAPNDTAEDIANRQLKIYPDIIVDAVRGMQNGTLRPKQLPASAYRRFHPLSYDDRRLRFNSSPGAIMRQIKAFHGKYGYCWLEASGKHFKIIDAAFPEYNFDGIPGRVVTQVGDGVAVATARCEISDMAGIVIKKVGTAEGDILPASAVIKTNQQLVP